MARARKAAKTVKQRAMRSHLESKWIKEWRRLEGPELVEEFVFHPTRKWRADFAHLETQTLIEIEGGAAGGRHTRVSGFKEDLTKYLTAYLHGYTVVRVGAHQITSPIVRAVIGALRSRMNSAESSEAGDAGAVEERWRGVQAGADRRQCDRDSGRDARDLPAWLGGGTEWGGVN